MEAKSTLDTISVKEPDGKMLVDSEKYQDDVGEVVEEGAVRTEAFGEEGVGEEGVREDAIHARAMEEKVMKMEDLEIDVIGERDIVERAGGATKAVRDGHVKGKDADERAREGKAIAMEAIEGAVDFNRVKSPDTIATPTQELVQNATMHAGYFEWALDLGPITSSEIGDNLCRFDGKIRPLEEAFLKNRSVNNLFYFLVQSREGVHTINSTELPTTFTMNNKAIPGLIDSSTRLISAADNSKDHWYLIAVEQLTAQFLGNVPKHALAENHGWGIRHQRTTLGNDPDYAIVLSAQGEALLSSSDSQDRTDQFPYRLLSSTELSSGTTAELRLRCLQLFPQPREDGVHAGTCLALLKREEPAPIAQGPSPPTKKPRMLHTRKQPVLFDSLVSSTTSLDEILKLVYAIGCPQVFSDLVAALQTPQKPLSDTSAYVKSEVRDVHHALRRRVAAIYLHLRNEKRIKYHQKRLRVERQKRRQVRRNQRASGGSSLLCDQVSLRGQVGKSAQSYAIEDLVAEWFGVPVDGVRECANYAKLQRSLRETIEAGRMTYHLEAACGAPVWAVMPTRPVLSPHKGLMVNPYMYFGLSPEEILQFGQLFIQFRHKLHGVLGDFVRNIQSMWEDPKVRIKLGNLSPNFLLEQDLDSDVLLDSMGVEEVQGIVPSSTRPLEALA